jgi:hypothetical protein
MAKCALTPPSRGRPAGGPPLTSNVSRLMVRTALLCAILPIAVSPAAAMKPAWSTDVFFRTNSDVIEQAEVQRLISALPSVPSRFPCVSGTWFVVGHADPTEGSSKEAAALSKRRARAVATSMQNAGISDLEINVEFKGSTQPVAKPPHHDNRRVEIEYAPCWAGG